MRVLALMTEAFGGYGGIAQYNRDLLEALSGFAAAPEVEVLTRFAPDGVAALPARVRQYPACPGRRRFGLTALALAARARPDVIFCGHLHLGPLAAWIARRRRSALLCQTHGIDVWGVPSGPRRRAMEGADAVLCVSRDTRARVLGWADMPPERVHVVPNTLGDEFTPADGSAMRRRLGLGESKAILSVSRLDARENHKGQDLIIRRLPALAARGLDVIYLIAGEGGGAARLRAMAEATGVAERVKFLGRVPQADLPDLYRAADLFALPSTGDGFGIVFLEAMACGAPALGFGIGGVADALADGALGILTDEAGLLDAIAAALHAPRPGPPLAAAVRGRFGKRAFRARLEAAFDLVARNRAPAHAMASP